MSTMSEKDHLDSLFRKAAEEYDTPFDEKAWDELNDRLDGKEPAFSLQYYKVTGLLLLLFVLLSLFVWFVTIQNTQTVSQATEPAQREIIDPSESATTGENKLIDANQRGKQEDFSLQKGNTQGENATVSPANTAEGAALGATGQNTDSDNVPVETKRTDLSSDFVENGVLRERSASTEGGNYSNSGTTAKRADGENKATNDQKSALSSNTRSNDSAGLKVRKNAKETTALPDEQTESKSNKNYSNVGVVTSASDLENESASDQGLVLRSNDASNNLTSSEVSETHKEMTVMPDELMESLDAQNPSDSGTIHRISGMENETIGHQGSVLDSNNVSNNKKEMLLPVELTESIDTKNRSNALTSSDTQGVENDTVDERGAVLDANAPLNNSTSPEVSETSKQIAVLPMERAESTFDEEDLNSNTTADVSTGKSEDPRDQASVLSSGTESNNITGSEASKTGKITAILPGETTLEKDRYVQSETVHTEEGPIITRHEGQGGHPYFLSGRSERFDHPLPLPEVRLATFDVETPYHDEMENDEDNEEQSEREKVFALKLMVAPDLSSIGYFEPDELGTNIGLLAEYYFGEKWSISGGAIYSRKIYFTDEQSELRQYTSGRNVSSLDAECAVLDIPVNLNYYAIRRERYNFIATVGLSSYFMLTEDYRFLWVAQGNTTEWTRRFEGRNTHGFSILNVSVTYERRLNDHFYIQVEPFMKAPLSGVGEWEVDLVSSGLSLNLKYNFLRP